MQAFEINEILARQKKDQKPYLEFLRVPDLSVGLYVLPAGGTDPQQPHKEDEVYYVIEGEAMIQVAGEDRPVKPGSVIYVAKGIEHRYHSIRAELRILVFFAPAESG